MGAQAMTGKLGSAADRDTASARDLRRQGKVRQIVEAAREVFMEDGFAEASMDEIVRKAGVSKRTLYNYYASKEEIFIDVMQRQLGLLYEDFGTDRKRSEALADQLQRIGIDMLRIANSPETLSLFRITAAEAHRFPKLARQFFEQSFENVIDGIAATLDRETGQPGRRIADTRQAGEYFLDLLFGTAYHRVVFGTIPPMNDKAIKARTGRALKYFFETYQAVLTKGTPEGGPRSR
jgi:TetR/AcrR family transcriptional regulator, mexJK operon transcriptional repressor